MTEEKQPVFHSGFVAMIGRPNVGKSTLLNQVVGQKVAIMSNVAQTTRNKIQGVYTTKDAQLVFVDTPGVTKPRTKLGDFMERSTYSALSEVDAVLYVVSAVDKRGMGDQFIVDHVLDHVDKPVYLVVNKIDQVHPNDLPAIVDEYKGGRQYAGVIPVSALNGNNVDQLLSTLVAAMPAGPQYYPADQVSDHPERFVIAEIIREKVFHLTRDEVPHSVAVDVTSVKDQGDNHVQISANIVVERPGQKGIIIGKKGAMLKKIGILARKDIEALLGSHVYLQLWVKVVPKWRDKSSLLKEYGYRNKDY
ncbi:GTPase Era [[Lactobacillus] timonensis]|uniref:GTPase Era n=1 Tax=[Lactobacillus] timonensis TaxID=1970790 RepID=UPI000C843444|nr:GTPase Era [[Lactobacillus] timonensis]